MRAVYLLIGAVATLAVGSAWLVPGWVDWSAYRPQAEKIAGRVLGAPVRIEGEISLALLPTPEVRVRDIRSDAAQGLRTAGYAVGKLDAGALLSGDIALSELQLDDAELHLPANGDAAAVLSNLPPVVRFVDAQLIIPGPPENDRAGEAFARIPASITLRRVGASALQSVRNDRLQVEGTISPTGVPLALEADIRPNGRIGLEVAGYDGAAQLAMSGTLGDVGLSDGRLRFELDGDKNGNDRAAEEGPFGVVESGFDFEAASGRMSLYDIRARMGPVSAEGALGLALPGPRAVDGAITFGFFDLAAVDLAAMGAFFGVEPGDAGSGGTGPEGAGQDGTEQGDSPKSGGVGAMHASIEAARGMLARVAELTEGADIDLLLRADRLRAGTLDIRTPNVRIARGPDGDLRLDPLNAALPGNSDFSVFAGLSSDGTLSGEVAFLSDNFRAFLNALGVEHRRLAHVEDRFLRQLSAAGKLEFGPERLALRNALLSVDATDWTGDLELLEDLSGAGVADAAGALGLKAQVHTHRLDPKPYLPLFSAIGEISETGSDASVGAPGREGARGFDPTHLLGPGSDIDIAVDSAVLEGVEVRKVGARFQRAAGGGYTGRVEVSDVYGARVLVALEGAGRLSAFDSWRATMEAEIPDPDRLMGGLTDIGDGTPRSGLVDAAGRTAGGDLTSLAPIRLNGTLTSRTGRLSADLNAETGLGRVGLSGELTLEPDGVGLRISDGDINAAGRDFAISSGGLRYDGTGVQFDRLLMSGDDIGITVDGRLDRREIAWRSRIEFGLRNLAVERLVDPSGPVRLAGVLRVDGRIVAEAPRLSDLPHAMVGDGRLGGAAYIRIVDGSDNGGAMRLAPFRKIRDRLERHFPAPGRPVEGRLLFDGPMIRIRELTLEGREAGARGEFRFDTARERLNGRIDVTEEGASRPYVTINLTGSIADPGMQIGGSLVSPK